jgi:hypothetical protein
MSAQCEVTAKAAAGAPMSLFERWLTLWVFLCIVAGIALGQWLPAPFQALGRMEVAQVNLPVGLLIWVMIVPMLVKVDFGALHEVRRHMRGIGVTLFVNWLVKPFSMAFLAWLFVRHWFAPLLPAEQLDSYVAGLILLAAAPCTAMVFVWSRLSNGDPLFTLSQVALNDTIMVFAFAPIVGLPLGADRRQQLLRAGSGRGDLAVRLRVGRGAGDRRRRADRGAGDAAGRPHRERQQGLVRAGRALGGLCDRSRAQLPAAAVDVLAGGLAQLGEDAVANQMPAHFPRALP